MELREIPFLLYIEAAKAGAQAVDLVRLIRRVAEDIYRQRVVWKVQPARLRSCLYKPAGSGINIIIRDTYMKE